MACGCLTQVLYEPEGGRTVVVASLIHDHEQSCFAKYPTTHHAYTYTGVVASAHPRKYCAPSLAVVALGLPRGARRLWAGLGWAGLGCVRMRCRLADLHATWRTALHSGTPSSTC